MFEWLFETEEEREKSKAIRKLVHEGTPNTDFFLLVIFSVMVATFGLFLNNVPIIVGSMLISPILSPVLGISMGAVMLDHRLLLRSIFTVLRALIVGLGSAAAVAAIFYNQFDLLASSFIQQVNVSLPFFLVSVIAGFAVAIAAIKPELNPALPGVAITVALIPPVAASGAAFSLAIWELAWEGVTLFSLNVTGIVAASATVFLMMRLYNKRRVAEEAIETENEALAEEEEEA